MAWKAQAQRFQRILKSAGVFEKTLVLDVLVGSHHVRWRRGHLERWAGGRARGIGTSVATCTSSNALGFRIVSLSPEEVHADPEHGWGPAPYHYTQDVYDLIIERVRKALDAA